MYFCTILERKRGMKMLKFEIKKVFSKGKNRMAVVILLVILVVVSMLTMNRVGYVDENGGHMSGIQAARKLRTEQNKWKGYLTEDVFARVVGENASINTSENVMSGDIRAQDKAYAKKQGISGIAELINNAFSAWRDYNYYAIDNVSEQEAGRVYARRISNLKEWFASGEERFTDAEKDFLIKQYENLKKPFYYEYAEGWSALLQNLSTFLLILALVIGFLVSGIFSDEFLIKADSIFFSSKLGRNKAILAKAGAGFLITTIFYVVFVVLYTMIVLLALGPDGANCPIQLDMWRSVYNITFFQAYLFIVAGGYVGTLFASLLAMIVSAASHSTATAIIVPFMILCAFPFLSRVITLPGVCAVFPDQLLEIYISIKDFGLIQLGGKVCGVAETILPVYAAACLCLFPALYLIYKKAEVK